MMLAAPCKSLLKEFTISHILYELEEEEEEEKEAAAAAAAAALLFFITLFMMTMRRQWLNDVTFVVVIRVTNTSRINVAALTFRRSTFRC